MNGTWQPNGFFLTKRVVVVCKKDQWQMVGTLKCIPSLPLVPASLFSRHGKTRRLPKWCEFALDTGESPFLLQSRQEMKRLQKEKTLLASCQHLRRQSKTYSVERRDIYNFPTKKKELDYWQKANKTCKQDKLALSLPSFAGETLLLCCILYYPTLHKLYEKSLGEESGRS